MNIFMELKQEIDTALQVLFAGLMKDDVLNQDEKLTKAMQYATTLGGKRFRPILGVLCAEVCHAQIKREILIKTLLSVELIHAYSLIHDDLPAIDNDLMRRGKPTVWSKFDVPTAIIAGDALQALAFENLAQNAPEFCLRKLILILAKNSGYNGMCGGQMNDIFVNHEKITIEDLININGQKTGKLIMSAAEFGTILARASFEQTTAVLKFAENVGLAFQIRDDLQDNDGVVSVLGVEQTNSFLSNLLQECLIIADKLQSENFHKMIHFLEKK